MLRELYIRNFAIIEEARIAFGPGFNILTGETGAGKSLLVGALELALGERASADWICAGAEEAQVEAVFEPAPDAEARRLLEEGGYPVEDLLIVRRTLARSGKSRIYVNDRPSTVGFLESLGRTLVDIHGQHEHQSLLHIHRHRELVDLFGGLTEQQAEVAELVRKLRKCRRDLDRLDQEQAKNLADRELALQQLEEISRAGLRPGEEEELDQERRKLGHAERLREICLECEALLLAERDSVIDRLGRLRKRLREAAQFDPSLEGPAGLMDAALPYLEEAAQSVRQYASNLEGDPDRLEQIEERLAFLSRLKRKYRASIEEILAHGETLRLRVGRIERYDEERSALEREIHTLERALLKAARDLSAARMKAASSLEGEMKKELKAIGMKEVEFRVEFRALGEEETPGESGPVLLAGQRLSACGLDQVEFLVRTNPGQPFKPLQRIASGGELSRIMLALRNALHRADRLPTLVFDEVDAGIGGAEAEAVGARLQALSRHFQVLCITHLPQIAVFAGTHFKVSKEVSGRKTAFRVERLEPKAREEEIARMLGGAEITPKAYAHAREMLERGSRKEAG